MSKSDSYKPGECDSLGTDGEPCWGQVESVWDYHTSELLCEGHIGKDYTPEPSREVAKLKAERDDLQLCYGRSREQIGRMKADCDLLRSDNAHLKCQRDIAVDDCEKLAKDVDTVRRERDQINRFRCDDIGRHIAEVERLQAERNRLRHERDALIDDQIIKQLVPSGDPVYFHLPKNVGTKGDIWFGRENLVKRIRQQAGLPETEPTT